MAPATFGGIFAVALWEKLSLAVPHPVIHMLVTIAGKYYTRDYWSVLEITDNVMVLAHKPMSNDGWLSNRSPDSARASGEQT